MTLSSPVIYPITEDLTFTVYQKYIFVVSIASTDIIHGGIIQISFRL
jgi:hypothetical protein